MPSVNCHPERSEGSEFCGELQIPRFARDDNSLLPKQIILRGPDQFSRPTASSAIRIAPNDARGSACQLAADQSRSASQFVRYCVDRRVQRVAVRIATTAVVDQRPHAGNANRHFRQAFPPGTPETIADDDCDLDPKL